MRKTRRGVNGKRARRHYRKHYSFLERLKRFFDSLAE